VPLCLRLFMKQATQQAHHSSYHHP
jgi:hypothetical protein